MSFLGRYRHIESKVGGLLLLVIALSGGPVAAQTQKVVYGTVIGSDSTLLSSVVISQLAAGQVVGYTFTSGSGAYALQLSTDSPIFLSVKHLGYRDTTITVTDFSSDSLLLDIILQSTDFKLPEVIVTDRKSAFSIAGDTTTYNADAYRTGQEQNAEELIANLPGFEVSETGFIKYYGRDVSTVTIEGTDVLGGDYTRGNKALPAEAIESVQAIENFDEDYVIKPILGESDEVAVNLVLKDSFKVKPTGDVSAAYGPTDSYVGGFSRLSVGGGVKYVLGGELNSIGETMLTQGLLSDPFLLAGGSPLTARAETNHYSQGWSLTEPLTSLVADNHSQGLTTNFAWNQGRKWFFQTSIYLNHDIASFQQSLVRTYTLPDSFSAVHVSYEQNARQTFSGLDAQIEYRINARKRLYIESRIGYQSAAVDPDRTETDSALSDLRFSTQQFFLSQYFTYSYRVGLQQALRITAGVQYRAITDEIAIRNTAITFQAQDNKTYSPTADLKLEWFLSKNALFTLRSSTQLDELRSKNIYAIDSLSGQRNEFRQLSSIAVFRQAIELGPKLKLVLLPGVQYRNSRLNSANTSLLTERSFFIPSAQATYQASEALKITGSYSIKSSSPSLDMVSGIPLIQTALLTQRGSGENPVFYSMETLLGNLKYRNAKRQIEVSLIYSLNKTKGGYRQEVQIRPPIQENTFRYAQNNLLYQQLSASIDKLFYPSLFYIKATSGLNRVGTFVVNNNKSLSTQTTSITNSLALRARLFQDITLRLGGEMDYLTQRIAGNTNMAIRYAIESQIGYKSNGYKAFATATYFKYSSQTPGSINLNFRISKDLTNDLNVFFSGENVLWKDTFTYREFDSLSDFSQTYTLKQQYVLIGFELYVGQ